MQITLAQNSPPITLKSKLVINWCETPGISLKVFLRFKTGKIWYQETRKTNLMADPVSKKAEKPNETTKI